MLRRPRLKPARALSAAVSATALLFGLAYVCYAPSGFVHEHLPSWPPAGRPSPGPPSWEPLPLPAAYAADDDGAEPAFCRDRFGTKYLTDLRSTAFQYCNVSASSPAAASLSCFHSRTASDGARDSLCVVRGAVLDPGGGGGGDAGPRFVLAGCDVRPPGADDVARGVVPFSAVRGYWYDTGPRYLFDHYFAFRSGGGGGGLETANPASPTSPPRYALLVKREGAANPWHCLLEIWSMTMTLDVLRMARDEAGQPFFPDDDDDIGRRLQVVVLDDHADGPYYDLWTLLSGRPPLRIGSPEARRYLAGDGDGDGNSNSSSPDVRLVVPLAGASNPTWQNDWTPRACTQSATLRTFVARVLAHYGVGTEEEDEDTEDSETPRITLVDRAGAGTRRLRDQAALLAALRAAYPGVRAAAVDLGALPFAEQLRVVRRRTDVLVGVHGAGLTHALFLPPRAAAVVELQPADMDPVYMGFRNLANLRGLAYFRARAEPVETGPPEPQDQPQDQPDDQPDHRPRRRAPWHTEDFAIPPDVFVRAVGAAIESVYNKGLRTHEVV